MLFSFMDVLSLAQESAEKLGQTMMKKGSNKRAGVNSAIAESRALLNDEDLKLHVYKKTLQAYLYPITNTTPHKFIVWTAKKPAHCYECEGLLWGLARQGLRCIDCGVKCHERCQDLLNADCLQKAAVKSSQHGSSDKTQNIIEAIRSRMEEREKEKGTTFNMIRDLFNIPAERHVKHMKASKQSVLDGTCKWSAKLSVTIVEAKGLQAKDKTGASDPYVTVEVGKTKKRTKTIFNTLDPVWNATYDFECHDSSDRLKIQVWDEDDDIKAVVKQKLLRESDDFLGHTLIVIHTLSGDMDAWYNLEKRTDRSAVSGTIHVKINVEIKGEEKCAPYRRQYTCLHENIFHHIMKSNDNKLQLPDQRGVEEGWKLYFKEDAQDVISEFALRYGIEPMYQAMTHFSCLSSAYQSVGARAVMAHLLANITKYFHVLKQEKNQKNQFEASNFGKEKFLKLLDNLLNSLRIDMSMYRKNFPSTGLENLAELKACINLINAIIEFRVKVLNMKAESDSIIGECCRQCMQKSYEYMFENCNDMYADYLESTSEAPPENDDKPDCGKTDSLEYWMRLSTLLTQIFDEDKTSYAPIFQQNSNVQLFDISVQTLWSLFSEDLEKALSLHSAHTECQSKEFMNLQFKIKWIYNEYVSKTLTDGAGPPRFFSLFEPFTTTWLKDNESDSISIMQAAFVRDKKHGFKKTSEHSLFSSSIVDVFSQVNQSYGILTKLDCSDVDVRNGYLKKFSMNIETVLIAYSKLIQSTFPEHCKDIEIACILMNNIQQGRILLEKLYQTMGGESLSEEVCQILTEIQNKLNSILDRLAEEFASTNKEKLHEACSSLGQLLRAIKGSGMVAPTASTKPTRESDAVIKPLMDVLDTCLCVFGKSSEKTVLKRVLKELWKLVITTMEVVVVLPGIAKDEEECQSDPEQDNKFLSALKDAGREDASKSLTPKHCTVLETALYQIKDYFHASGNGLKRGYLDKSSELKKLSYALSLYTQTTDALIKLFVQSQKEQDSVDESSLMGEVNVQVDLFTHPGTGEHKVTVKVIAGEGLKWKVSSMFRPFIEVNMIGPYLGDKRRQFATKCRSNTASPKYNETFTFQLSNEATLDIYEVQLIAKDYCFAREDKIIGIAILQLREIVKQGSCACWCPLVNSMHFNQTGKTVLRILSQRLGDNIAREFVHIKASIRSAEPV
ncbi:protein unc-13 homolog B-like isoform X2 [Styela clava]